MLSGIEIMLERMKTHPDEFVVEGKYTSAFHRVKPFLTEEEFNAVKTALTEAHRQFFTGEVMSIVAGESKKIDHFPQASLSDYVTGNASHYLTGSTNQIIGASTATYAPSAFGSVPVKAEGAKVPAF